MRSDVWKIGAIRRAVGGIAVLLLAGNVALFSSAASVPAGEVEAAKQDKCLNGQLLEPQVFGIKQKLKRDDGKPRALRVLVLLDGVSEERGKEVFAQINVAYELLRIYPTATYREVTVTLPAKETDPVAFIAEARRLVNGVRPSDVDVVHLLTIRNFAGAGYSACIGGVAFDTLAFSVSEELKDRPPELSRGRPIPWPWGDTTALTMAHEIGHLMGGEHVLANCVEGLASPIVDLPRPCTLMDPSVAMAMRFSTANGLVVRGYAVRYLTRQA